MMWWTGRQGSMMRTVARLRPLTFLVLVFVATSFVLTLTIGNPRADELYFLGLHIQTLLAAETLGVIGLMLLGVDFLSRPGLRKAGWLVLAVVLATTGLLADIFGRLYFR